MRGLALAADEDNRRGKRIGPYSITPCGPLSSDNIERVLDQLAGVDEITDYDELGHGHLLGIPGGGPPELFP